MSQSVTVGYPDKLTAMRVAVIERCRAPRARRFWAIALVFTGCVLVAFLNRHHTEQQTNFWSQYVSLAQHWSGEVTREVMTYPIWGYSAVLWVIREPSAVILPQIVLGTAALIFALRAMLMDNVLPRGVLIASCLLGLPWYALHSVKWPLSFAASLLVVAGVALATSLQSGQIRYAWVAGILVGLALYFRSEYLLVSAFLLVFLPVTLHGITPLGRTIATVGLVAFVAAASLIPWAVYYHQQTGVLSLTPSQKGIVAFISLGQLPNNPWGARYDDGYAFEYLRGRNLSAPPYSHEGDRVLFEEFKTRVRDRPDAYVAKMGWNAFRIVVGGFYNPEPCGSAECRRDFGVIWASLRSGDRMGPEPVGPVRAWLAVLYWGALKVVGAAFLLLTIIGLSLTALRRYRWTPLIAVFGGVLLCQLIVQVVLTVEPRYQNCLYVFAVPFFVRGVMWMRASVPFLVKRIEG